MNYLLTLFCVLTCLVCGRPPTTTTLSYADTQEVLRIEELRREADERMRALQCRMQNRSPYEELVPTKTTKGLPAVIYDHFIYRVGRRDNNGISYRCLVDGCCGALHVNAVSNEVKVKGRHNKCFRRSVAQLDAFQALVKMKTTAVNKPFTKVGHIRTEICSTLTETADEYMPSAMAQKKKMWYLRQKEAPETKLVNKKIIEDIVIKVTILIMF